MANPEPGKKKPAILFISYYFYPSSEVGAKRPTATARYLAQKGYDVTVIRAREPGASDGEAGNDDVEVVPVVVPRKPLTALLKFAKSLRRPERSTPSTRDGAGSATESTPAKPAHGFVAWLRRQFLAFDTSFQGYKLWLVKVVLRVLLLRLRGRADLIVASGPPFVGYIGAYFASKLHTAPLLLDFRDPWYLHGDAERKTEILGHPAAHWENGYGQKCVSRAELITVASPGIERHCREVFATAATRIELIRNGFDASAVIDEPIPAGRLELLYAGSLYWNRNPFPFLECLQDVAAEDGVDRSKIRLSLLGDCADWEGVPLAPWIEERGLADIVRIIPPVTPDELRTYVADSNVLINFAQGQPRQIPAKSYEYLASQRDVITIAEGGSDVAALFGEAGVGHTVSPDDTSALRAAILACYEKHTVPTTATTWTDRSAYSRETQSARFHELVEGLLTPRRRNTTSGS